MANKMRTFLSSLPFSEYVGRIMIRENNNDNMCFILSKEKDLKGLFQRINKDK